MMVIVLSLIRVILKNLSAGKEILDYLLFIRIVVKD
jgi:hypothetical protein